MICEIRRHENVNILDMISFDATYIIYICHQWFIFFFEPTVTEKENFYIS
jgi:hypothetical protein